MGLSPIVSATYFSIILHWILSHATRSSLYYTNHCHPLICHSLPFLTLCVTSIQTWPLWCYPYYKYVLTIHAVRRCTPIGVATNRPEQRPLASIDQLPTTRILPLHLDYCHELPPQEIKSGYAPLHTSAGLSTP